MGVIFIVHGYSKFNNDGFVSWISSMGIPGELSIIIALAEVIPGILLLIIGVLNRISASIISIIMVGRNISCKRRSKYHRRQRN